MSGGYVYIYNELDRLRIENRKTKVVSYMAKNNLVIQKDNDSTFFFQYDSYVKYFKFDEIAQPFANDLDEMLKQIVDMLAVDFSNEMISTSEIEKADTVLDINVYSDKNDNLIAEKSTNSTLSTYASNLVYMDVNTIPANDRNILIRQSKEYVNIPSGKINITLVSGKFVQSKDASPIDINSVGPDDTNEFISRIGLFDDSNGIFVQYKATNVAQEFVEEYSITKVIDGVVETIPQSDWNTDKCDGNGISRVVIDKNSMNTFIFRLGTLPNTFIQVGIFSNGKIYLVHEFNTEHFFRKLPVRWEIQQFAVNEFVSPLQMIQNNSVVLSNEKHNITKRNRSTICPVNTFKSITSEATQDVIFDIKLNSAYSRSKVKLEKITIVNKESTGIVMWKLIKNGTLVDQATDTDVVPTYDTISAVDISSLNSYQSYDENNNLVLNDYLKVKDNTGYLISSGYILGNNISEIDLTNDSNVIYCNVDGVSENITLVVQYVNSPAEIQASTSWIEYE